MLLFGPPGVGKTSLAHVIAAELQVPIKATAGPIIERAGDLAALLTALEPREILFVDEIHRLDAKVEEILYPALEDQSLDLMIGSGPGARSMKIPLKPFTLVAATTRAGLLTAPLRGRFGIVHRLDFYTQAGPRADRDALGAASWACRSTRTGRARSPRAAAARRASRTACCGACATTPRCARAERSPRAVARDALTLLEVDTYGFDEVDRRLLLTIIEKFGGGPVGVNALAAAISEEPDAIEDIYEPYLLQLGFLDRTPRGRTATRRAYEHLGLPVPDAASPPRRSSFRKGGLGGDEVPPAQGRRQQPVAVRPPSAGGAFEAPRVRYAVTDPPTPDSDFDSPRTTSRPSSSPRTPLAARDASRLLRARPRHGRRRARALPRSARAPAPRRPPGHEPQPRLPGAAARPPRAAAARPRSCWCGAAAAGSGTRCCVPAAACARDERRGGARPARRASSPTLDDEPLPEQRLPAPRPSCARAPRRATG